MFCWSTCYFFHQLLVKIFTNYKKLGLFHIKLCLFEYFIKSKHLPSWTAFPHGGDKSELSTLCTACASHFAEVFTQPTCHLPISARCLVPLGNWIWDSGYKGDRMEAKRTIRSGGSLLRTKISCRMGTFSGTAGDMVKNYSHEEKLQWIRNREP